MDKPNGNDKPDGKWWKSIPATAWVTWALIVLGFVGGMAVLHSDVMRNSAFAERHPGEYLALKDRVTVVESRVAGLEKAAIRAEGTDASVQKLQVAVESLTQQIIALADKIDTLGRRIEKKGL